MNKLSMHLTLIIAKILNGIEERVIHKHDLRWSIEDILIPNQYVEWTREDLRVRLDQDIQYCITKSTSDHEINQLRTFETRMIKAINSLNDI